MKKMGSLMQGLKEKKLKCKVHNCNNTWIWSGAQQLKAMTEGKGEPPRRMCQTCFDSYNSMKEKEVPCAKPGCSGKVTLSKYSQLATQHKKHKSSMLCENCLKEKETIKPIEAPCKIEGCNNIWQWSPKDQITSRDGKIPQRMCTECYSNFNKLQNIEVQCKRESCDKTWTFTRMHQLKLNIKDITKKPHLFCSKCYDVFNSLSDISVDCKIGGCDNTWTWNRFSQLNFKLEESGGSPPQRMCESCHSIFSETKELSHNCRIPGCKETWMEKRGSVFSRIKNNQPVPHKLCDKCFEKLNTMENISLDCKNKKFGCKDQWMWKKESQLSSSMRLKESNSHSPNKACNFCTNFMAENISYFLKCSKCGADIIFVSSEYQLKIHHGFMGKPTDICNECRE